MKLKIINNDEHSTHVALSGRFDCEGVAEVFEDFKRNVTDRKLPAILDMTEMDFISSLGLRTLQVAAQELKTHGAKRVMYNPQPLVAGEPMTAAMRCAWSPRNPDPEEKLYGIQRTDEKQPGFIP